MLTAAPKVCLLLIPAALKLNFWNLSEKSACWSVSFTFFNALSLLFFASFFPSDWSKTGSLPSSPQRCPLTQGLCVRWGLPCRAQMLRLWLWSRLRPSCFQYVVTSLVKSSQRPNGNLRWCFLVVLTTYQSLLLVMNPLFPQESQGCVHADTRAQGCAPSCALMTTTVPTRRSAATTDVDTSALHRTQVLFDSHTSISDQEVRSQIQEVHDQSGLSVFFIFFPPVVCQWNEAAADRPREPPCVPSTATMMESVRENRSAAGPPAGTTAASPADWTACSSLFSPLLLQLHNSKVWSKRTSAGLHRVWYIQAECEIISFLTVRETLCILGYIYNHERISKLLQIPLRQTRTTGCSPAAMVSLYPDLFLAYWIWGIGIYISLY